MFLHLTGVWGGHFAQVTRSSPGTLGVVPLASGGVVVSAWPGWLSTLARTACMDVAAAYALGDSSSDIPIEHGTPVG